MDFTRESGGRVLDNPKDIKACDKAGVGSTSLLAANQVAAACKDGYVPFRYSPVSQTLTWISIGGWDWVHHNVLLCYARIRFS